MPLFRSLGMRILDGFIDRFAVNGPVRIDTFAIPRQDYISRLKSVGDLYHAVGKITDYATGFNLGNFVTSPADYYCSSDESDGYRIDDVNHDSLLMPNSSGDFSISFWIYPCGYSGQDHVVIAKTLNTGFYRYKISISSSSVITFIAANRFGTAEENVTSPVTFGRWNFVVARCNGAERLLSLDVLGEDGVVDRNEKDPLMDVGCWNPAGPLTVAVDSDLVSGKLAAGRFLLQQVCFWGKVLSAPEERELFFDGRGNQRWHDRSIPDTYQVHAGTPKLGHVGSVGSIMQDANGTQITVIHDQYETSPYVPCKSCDSEPNCWHFANKDVSPDSISVYVTWVASMNSNSASLPVSNVVLNRNQNQIVHGFRFGRTFESEAIPLTNGIEVVFFLESTPYHMLAHDYRRYFGVECRLGEKKKIVKFRLTSGVPLVKNPEPGAENVFKSPSPSGAMFNFPYSDSFQQYASDIVSAGWTDFAQVLNYEPFPFKPGVEAACLVANGYRFTIGKEEPWDRGGDYGWQMGVSEFASNPPQTMDSLYNYLIKASGPGVFPNKKVVASEAGLNSPFSAVAKDVIVAHDEKNNRTDLSGLPFDASAFIAVMTSGQFVRPEPFVSLNSPSRSRTGIQGCIDCDITASFYSQYNVFTLNPKRLRSVTIPKTKCPQKTTSGAISVYSSGAAEEGAPDAQAVSRVLYAGENNSLFRVDGTDNPQSMLVGGTLRPDGSMQFSGQIEQPGIGNYPSLFYDIRPDTKIDPNNPGTYLVPISKTTKLDARNGLDFGLNFPIQPTETIDEYNSRRLEFYQEENPDSGFYVTTDGWGQFPVGDIATIVVGNCAEPACPSRIDRLNDLFRHTSSFGGIPSSLVEIPPFVVGAIPKSFSRAHSSGLSRITGSVSGGLAAAIALESCPNPSDGPGGFGTQYVELFALGAVGECRIYPPPDLCEYWSRVNAPSGNEVSLGYRKSTATINSIRVTYDPATRLYSCVLGYVINYEEALDVVISTSLVATLDILNAAGSVVGQCSSSSSTSSVTPVLFGVKHTREVKFVAEREDDKCLNVSKRIGNGKLKLIFESGTLISKGDYLGTGPNTPQSDLDDRVLNAVNNFGFWGIASISGTSFSLSKKCSFVVCNPPCAPPPGGRFASVGTVNITGTFSTLTGLDPDALVPVEVLEFGDSYVELSLSAFDTVQASIAHVGYSDLYHFVVDGVSTFYDGDHELEKEIGSYTWRAQVGSSEFDYFLLSVPDGRLELFRGSPTSQNGIGVVARYRIAGYPDSRFNRLGKTQMQLVSADWSVGQWPFYVIVEPV